MKYSFSAKIYKTGINPCVDVPLKITAKMVAAKGYIPIKGTINGFSFHQTLVAVKNSNYRLHVNGIMLKGAHAKLGNTVKFIIEQNLVPLNYRMPVLLKKELVKNALMPAFKKLTLYRQKEILRYLGFLKTEAAILKNVEKVIVSLREKAGTEK